VGFLDLNCQRIPFSRGQTYFGLEAYRFFLEVVCGLHSPIVGETEVMGQFKDLIDGANSIAEPIRSQALRFLKQVLTDAKNVRQTALRDLGSRTYGSLIRKFIKESPSVTVLGSGKLAEELLPWFKNGPPVHLLCRNGMRAKSLKKNFPFMTFSSLQDFRQPFMGTLIIAAPMTAYEIETLIGRDLSKLGQVIDLRDSSTEDFLSLPVITLEQFFSQIKEVEKDTLLKASKARELVKELAQKVYDAAEHRPFGWEDLCG
jgi:glutamyl-tRNA reductase